MKMGMIEKRPFLHIIRLSETRRVKTKIFIRATIFFARIKIMFFREKTAVFIYREKLLSLQKKGGTRQNFQAGYLSLGLVRVAVALIP